MSSADPDPDWVRRAYLEGRHGELEDRLRRARREAESDSDVLNAHLNLYRFYHASQRFREAHVELENAERALGRSGVILQALRGEEIGRYATEARMRLNVEEQLYRLAQREPASAASSESARTEVVVLPFEEGGSITALGSAMELYLNLELLESERVQAYERRHLAQLLDHQRVRPEGDPALEGADIILTGLVLENSSIDRQPEIRERTVRQRTQGGQVVERTERYIAQTRVRYQLAIQGRITETAGGSLVAETFRVSLDQWYPEEGPRNEAVVREAFETVATDLVRWVNVNF